ncbi:MAG: hypothetical protein PHQ40_17160 [Anaerolineaceae bacterium]|nr:hypothetical protein [Anaerolineaceae bacterium]
MKRLFARILKFIVPFTYIAAVAMLVTGLTLPLVSGPVLANNVEDRSSLNAAGSGGVSPSDVWASVKNDGAPMQETSKWFLWFSASGSPADGTIVQNGVIPALGSGETFTAHASVNQTGNYQFQFKRLGGGQTGDDVYGGVNSINCDKPTSTPTATKTSSPTHTPSQPPTSTHTPTPTFTHTSTSTATETPTLTSTPTNTPTLTTTPTETPTHTSTPTETATYTLTPTMTSTPNVPGDSPTPTNTPTDGPTLTNTPTSTATNTEVPPTSTPTNTDTPVPPTNTPTNTPVPPTSTPTLTQTATSFDPDTPTPTNTATGKEENTATPVPPAVKTALPVPPVSQTKVLFPVTGADDYTVANRLNLSSSLFINLGIALFGMSLLLHGLYLKLSRG